MNKRGIAIEQVFIFILAAVTFAVILIFGYKSISGFMEKGEDVTFIRFKTDLESSIKKIATEYGAVRIQEFYPPLNYEYICFVDMDYFFDEVTEEQRTAQINKLCGRSGDMDENMPLACNVWEDALAARQANLDKDNAGYDAVEENVFLKPFSPVKIKVSKISIAPLEKTDGTKEPKGYICIPLNRGSFTLQLTGKGSHTEISEVKLEE